MDKSSESSSDSDSNSSTSWVFVYDSSAPVQNPTNTFHLDCSREPIQELTEQDLLSASSDIESDTDGISVISESEIPTDDPFSNQISSFHSGVEEVEENESVSHDNSKTHTENVTIPKENEKVTRIEWRRFLKSYNILGIGFVVTAIFLASFNQILTKFSAKNADEIQKDSGIISYDEIDLMPEDNRRTFYGAKRGLDKELEQIVDMTISCTYGEKSKNKARDREIKRCVRKQYKSKRMACLKKNAGLTDEEALILSDIPNDGTVDNDNINIRNVKATKHKLNSKKKNKYTADTESNKDYKIKRTNKEGKLDKNDNKENIGDHKLKQKKKYISEEKFKGGDGDKQELQKEKLKYKGQMPVKKPYKYQKDKNEYKENKKYNQHESKYNSFKKNFNKHQANNKVFASFNSKEEKVYKNKEIINKNSTESKHRHANKVIVMQQKQENNSSNGDWYTNLHKARTQIRKQEHASDWVFDRAYLRSKKRNKAQWYFKWMNIREQLRYKQSYRPYSS